MKPMSKSRLMNELKGAILPAGLSVQNRQKLLEMIADRISTYWRFQKSTSSAPTEREMRDLLRTLHEDAANVRKQLMQLPETAWREIALAAGTSDGGDLSPFRNPALPLGLARGDVLLRMALEAFGRFEHWVGKSLERTPEARRGRKPNDDRIWLIGQIGSVYEHYTDLKFDRRRKSKATPTDLVKHVLAIADPCYQQTSFNVDKLMRRAIARLRQWPTPGDART